ncbi:holo-ACP synthase [bacterium]|nr:holo-ACP synthase [bacterium]
MISGIGIDLVELERFRRRLDELGDALVSELFLPAEAAYCNSQARPYRHYAVRLAAKEAAFKALGKGLSDGLRFRDVEVVRESGGSVWLRFHGLAERLTKEQSVIRVHLSLTHGDTTAAAVVVMEAAGA